MIDDENYLGPSPCHCHPIGDPHRLRELSSRDPHLLTFLQDGVTTREDVYMKLAEPSAVWEDGRILTYQLDHNHQGYVPMRRRETAWTAKYSLVLSFDKQGILLRHSLVRMKDDPVVP